MQGSTFIFETEIDKLGILQEDLDALDDFDHVALDVLATLDFEMLVQDAGLRWMTDAPVFYDEAAGVVLARIAPDGLAHVLAHVREPHDGGEEEAADMDRLRAFVARRGVDHIYELATF